MTWPYPGGDLMLTAYLNDLEPPPLGEHFVETFAKDLALVSREKGVLR